MIGTEGLKMADGLGFFEAALPRWRGGPLTVTVVGRGDASSGIGSITHSWLATLANDHRIQARYLNSHPDMPDDVAYSHVQKIDDEEAAADPGDVAIFCDVIWNGYGLDNFQKCPISKLKICCPVFDSTQIPQQWVEVINTHFDMAIVPAKFLVDVLRSCGVHRPIFYLPIALQLKEMLRRPSKPLGRKYVFGAVGAFDFRKNIDLIADAFEAAFGLDNPNVELQLKLSYSLLDPAELDRFAASYRGTNITVHKGKTSQREYDALLDSIDCMINLSRGEGYSIPVREAIALGKPVIVSDKFAHLDLGDIDSAVFVKSDIPVPALYPQFNERFFGLQYMPFKTDAVNALKQVYDEREQFARRAEANRVKAEAWSVEKLQSRYRAAAAPRSVSLRGGPAEITDQGYVTADTSLYQRLHGIVPGACRSARNPQLGLAGAPKVVVIGNDGGFFSLFNRYASYLVWEKEANSKTIVLPDWRALAIKEYFGLSHFTSFCYASVEEGNGWLHLFEPSPDVDDPAIYDNTQKLYANALIADDFNEKREPWLTYKHAHELYRMPEFDRWRRWYNSVVAHHIRPLPSLQQRIDRNMDQLGDGYRIGVHIRHPSHAIEQPDAALSHIDQFAREIEAFIAAKRITKPKIFLATDQDSTIATMRARFGDALFCDPDVKRTTQEDDQRFASLSKSEQMREGHQIQHLTAANPLSWSSAMAAEVISDCYSLAACDALFHIVSNISTAASYINPNVELRFVNA